MNRFSEQARYVPERSPQRRAAADHRDPFAAHSFFDDASLDVCEVLSQVRTPLPLDLFFKHLSIAAKQQAFFYGKCSGCWPSLEAIR